MRREGMTGDERRGDMGESEYACAGAMCARLDLPSFMCRIGGMRVSLGASGGNTAETVVPPPCAVSASILERSLEQTESRDSSSLCDLCASVVIA